jgi:hypothetical protein
MPLQSALAQTDNDTPQEPPKTEAKSENQAESPAEAGGATRRAPTEADLAIKQLEVLRNDFQITKPADERALKLDEFISQALSTASTFNTELQFDDALRAINLALPIAMQTKSERSNELNDLAKDVRRRRTIKLRLEPQLDRLRKNKTDRTLARSLIEAYVLELDALPQAQQMARDAEDEILIARLELVGKDPLELSAVEAVDIGDWYYQMSQKPGMLKNIATGRAVQSYEAAIMTGIEDDKVKKRVELALKTLSPKDGAKTDTAVDASGEKVDVSVEGNAEMFRILGNLPQQLRPTIGRGFSESQRPSVESYLERFFFRGKTTTFKGTATNIRVQNYSGDSKVLYATLEFETRHKLRVRAWFKAHVKLADVDMIRQANQLIIRGPVESLDIWGSSPTIYLNIGYCKLHLSK